MAPSSPSGPLVKVFRYGTLVLLPVLVAEIVLLIFFPGFLLGARDSNSLDVSVSPATIAPLPPASAFQEAADRSLFSPDRKPRAMDQEATDEEGVLERWLLSGVVNTGTTTYAIFIGTGGDQRLRLEKGMYLERWKVGSIAADHVVVTDGDSEQILYMRETDTGAEKLRVNKAPARPEPRRREEPSKAED